MRLPISPPRRKGFPLILVAFTLALRRPCPQDLSLSGDLKVLRELEVRLLDTVNEVVANLAEHLYSPRAIPIRALLQGRFRGWFHSCYKPPVRVDACLMRRLLHRARNVGRQECRHTLCCRRSCSIGGALIASAFGPP